MNDAEEAKLRTEEHTLLRVNYAPTDWMVASNYFMDKQIIAFTAVFVRFSHESRNHVV